ncbi:hypothetical protein [Burkholderia ubonensis]|uniref:hypothetical protein n=1 Tax=Burkholderia ubonensis TaxID=101571 RepID=UPI000AF61CE8|nr:hypothetical protein [Burkholderia ubonensis]
MLNCRVIVPSPETVALFRALNACVGIGSLPHPIEARNARLVTIWRHFVRRHQDEKSAALIDDMLTTTQCRFDQNIEILCDCIQQDPAWRARACRSGSGGYAPRTGDGVADGFVDVLVA